MPFHRYDVNADFIVVYLINKSILLIHRTRVYVPFKPFERFRLSCTCPWVLMKFTEKAHHLLV